MNTFPTHRTNNLTQPVNLRKGTLCKFASQYAFKRGKGVVLSPIIDQQWLLRSYFCLHAQNEYINDIDDMRIIKLLVEISGCSEQTITELIDKNQIEEKYVRKRVSKPKTEKCKMKIKRRLRKQL